MKILQIKLIVASIFLVASVTVSAQSDGTKASSKEQRTEAKQKASNNNESTTAAKIPIVLTDYMNLEKKIMTWTIAGDIPATLPKYEKGQTKEEYQKVLRNWAKNNLHLIKKEFHVKVTSDKKLKKADN